MKPRRFASPSVTGISMFAETVAGTAPPPNYAPNEIDELCDLLTADPDDQSGPDETITVAVSETLMQVGGVSSPTESHSKPPKCK